MQLVDETRGWALTNERLSWTADGGESWTQITPPGISSEDILSVFFLDGSRGWVAALRVTRDQPASITVSRTMDAGLTWQSSDVRGPPQIGYGPPATTNMFIFFVDGQTGWLSGDYRTGMQGNGILFQTTDGGATWTRLPDSAGGGGATRFASTTDGWWIAGPGSDRLYTTHDGGGTWQIQTLDLAADQESPSPFLRYELPTLFEGTQDAVLPLRLTEAGAAAFYTSHDSGRSWQLAGTVAVPWEVSIAGPKIWFAAGPDQLRATQDAGSNWTTVSVDWSQVDPLAGTQGNAILGPGQLAFVSERVGWAILHSDHVWGLTPYGKPEGSATADALVKTADGGRTWTLLHP